ncbi:MAG: polyprenol monophosphomannose synthase [bacterium]
MSEPRILVFLPTFNEKGNLERLAERLLALAPGLSLLIVDDQSPDGTGEIADGLARTHPDRVQVLHRHPPRGRGLAGRDGLRLASQTDFDIVVEMDADLSHRPQDLPNLLAALDNADVVLGSRYVPGGGAEGFGARRRLNSRVAGLLSKWVLGLDYHDPTSGFRVFRRESLASLPWEQFISDGPSIVEEILYALRKRGYRIVEVPILFVERRVGESKISPGLVLKWIINLLRVRLNRHRL